MELEAIETEYLHLAPKYERLKEEVIYILQPELDARDIPVHLIEKRVKTLTHLVDKANRLNTDHPFADIVDICGIRVICVFRSDLSKIGEAIEAAFEVESKDDKISGTAEREFGYLSVHYVGKLPQHYRGPRYDDLKDLRFELQVRTIAMHAWDSVSHYIDYKSEHAVPSELRRDFYALSALFHLADSQFEALNQARQQVQQRVEQQALEPIGVVDEEINLDTLSAYLKRKFPDRRHSDSTSISGLITELVSVGYLTISHLDQDIELARNAFAHYEKRYFPGAPGHEGVLSDGGAIRVSLGIAKPEYAAHMMSRGYIHEDVYAHFRQYLPDDEVI